VHAVDQTGWGVGLTVSRPASQPAPAAPEFPGANRSGAVTRVNRPLDPPGRVRPLRLCHVALDIPKAGKEEAVAFYTDRLGFVPTDRVAKVGVFMRAPGDTDHHTLLLCHRPDRAGINHCAYEVARVDEVIVGANDMIDKGWHEARRLGRHTVESNIFRFISAPCGGRVEFAADMDRVDENYGPYDHEETPPHTIWTLKLQLSPGGDPPYPPVRARWQKPPSYRARGNGSEPMTTDYPEIKLYIDGEWSDGGAGRGDDVINPATEEVLGRVPFAEASDVDAAIAAARAAFPKWRDAGPVQMGPMVSERRRAAVHRLVEEAVGRGAKVALGGEPTPGTGYFYPPTVLVDVPADAELLREEPFGPVAPIAAFDALDEALSIANALPYGLAAYGYTDSAATAEKLIAGFEAGILSVNHCGGSVPQAPSGGVKESGYGKEGGPEGLAGYLVTKRVSHKLSL
jgi:hypothetical protein